MTTYQRTALKLATLAFDRLHVLNNQGWRNHRTILLDLVRKEEKQHRSGIGGTFNAHHPHALSVSATSQILAMHRVADYLCGLRMPAPKDVLHMQPSAIYAAALVDGFGPAIRTAWADLPPGAIANLVAIDYVQLVSPKS